MKTRCLRSFPCLSLLLQSPRCCFQSLKVGRPLSLCPPQRHVSKLFHLMLVSSPLTTDMPLCMVAQSAKPAPQELRHLELPRALLGRHSSTPHLSLLDPAVHNTYLDSTRSSTSVVCRHPVRPYTAAFADVSKTNMRGSVLACGSLLATSPSL